MPQQEPHQEPDELGQGIDEGVAVRRFSACCAWPG